MSNGNNVFQTQVYDSFIDLVNNTNIDFDYPDCMGYEVYLVNDEMSYVLK